MNKSTHSSFNWSLIFKIIAAIASALLGVIGANKAEN
ncbi:smalltalk protein [Prevotella sp. kh1p2]|jgi:uncharacterized membrane protein YtjA (UPF0391 family)|nr:smalltalk protein [Prevotella sp. kh1p2]SNU12078.1 hypothetical protein SAMN06298210_1183 [Prevotellaceae bacterium KH2P17]